MTQTPKSITYQHLLNIVYTQGIRFPEDRPLRILDAGCGDGYLVAYLFENLPLLMPGQPIEIYGFDVHDFEFEHQAKVNAWALENLTSRFPEADWNGRIASIGMSDPWPYTDSFFDIILSNQVLEHVKDHDAFFGEVCRTLHSYGYSVHVAPLRDCVQEVHLHLPFVHWINNRAHQKRYVRLASRIGLSDYKRRRREPVGAVPVSVAEYAEQVSTFLHNTTNYLSYAELLALAKRHRLRISLGYTRDFYVSKMRSLGGKSGSRRYPKTRSGFRDHLLPGFLKHVSATTVFVDKGA
jgi:SAM-dependent methyltransferase